MNNQQQYDLIVRAQAGDSDAMESLFSEYYNNVYYFALKTVKDPDLACDITQETFVEIMQTIGNLKEPAAFNQWIKKITATRCVNALTRTHVELQFAIQYNSNPSLCSDQ